MLKNTFYFFLLSLLFGACSQPQKQNGDQIPQIKHIRVVWVEHPSKEAVISWTTTEAAGKEHIVYLDTDPHNGDLKSYSRTIQTLRNGEITLLSDDKKEGVPPGFFHHSYIDSLQANTQYYFVVVSDGIVSEEYSFLTAPEDDITFKIVWGGDSRMGGPKPRYAGRTPHVDRQEMNKRIRSLFENDSTILAFAHGADYGSTAEWRHLYWWFEDHEIVKTSKNKLLPLIISQGNHDYAVGFKENFWLGELSDKDNHTYYYTSHLSPKVALLTLNTEISVAGNQREWLEKELQKLRPEMRWLIPHYHRPAFPAVKDYNNQTFARVRQAWTPLFEEYNIDLALESDGHVLKRTLPIRGEKYDETGIVYIGEGGLGVPQRTPDSTRWFLQDPGFATSAHHVHVLSFGLDSLHITAIGIQGDTIDHYSRVPRVLD